jgi:glutamate-ammonia-ligase adenylyltransferase
LLAERIAAHPLLLDELLDVRAAGAVPTRASLAAECTRMLDVAPHDDIEAALHALVEFRQGASFRIGLALLNRKTDALDAARQLAWLAETVLTSALALAQRAVKRSNEEEDSLAVIGYGSIGGEELGFVSDLDLVFLHAGSSDPDSARQHARLAQKLVSLLGTATPAGRLYEIDVRLRPDGAKGLLVASVDGFADYQRDRAWTWERLALVRARGIAGSAATLARFGAIRSDAIVQPRDVVALRTDVLAMRTRMREELDRTRGDRFDLKQGEGGLVDLEFLLQWLVLKHAQAKPELLSPRATVDLIATLTQCGIFSDAQSDALIGAHATLLQRSLDCTLDRRPRVVAMDARIDTARTAIREVCGAHGLEFCRSAIDGVMST